MRSIRHCGHSLLIGSLLCIPLSAQDDGPDKGSGLRFEFKNNPSIRFGKAFRVDFRAKIQGDVRTFSPDLTTDEGEFDLQRTRFGVDGNFLKHFEYEIEREFRESFGGRKSKNPWRDVNVNFRYFRRFQVRVGKFKAPFSMEQLTGAHNLDFILRSRIADELAPGRDVGITVRGRFFERALNYEAGVFRRGGEDENAESTDAETQGEHMYAGRVTGTPLHLLPVPEFVKDLQLGVSTTSNNVAEGLSGLRGKTASGKTFFPRMFVHGTRLRFGTELNWSPGPFSVKGEFIHVREERSGQSLRGTDLTPVIARGWYVTGTWAITGEKKAGGVEPRRPLFVDRGVGAVELAARYEQLRFGSSEHIGLPSRSPRASNILGNSDRLWTLGVNWYVNSFMKVQINGIHDNIEDVQRTPISGRMNYWMGIMRLQFVM